MPKGTLFDQRADELRQEKRIAFGVPVDEGKELTADLLPVKCR